MRAHLLVPIFCLHAAVALSAEQPPGLAAFLKQHCTECHDAETQKGSVRLDNLPADFRSFTHAETWLNVMDQLNAGDMPPKKKPRPPQEQTTALVEWISGQLRNSEAAGSAARLRRLSRYEYERTVSDLLGVTFRAAEDFPEDPTQFGFDNNAGALAISPTHLEKFMAAADEVLEQVIPSGPPRKAKPLAVDMAGLKVSCIISQPVLTAESGKEVPRAVLPPFGDFVLRGPTLRPRIPTAGEYLVRIRAAGTRGSKWPHPARLTLHQDGAVVFDVPVTAPLEQPQTFAIKLRLRRGDHEFIVVNGGAVPLGQGINQVRKRSAEEQRAYAAEVPCLVLEAMEFEGPLTHAAPLLQGSTDARAFLQKFMPRAFRRPVTADELQRIVGIVDAEKTVGASSEAAMRKGLRAVLCSPHFLFHAEPNAGRISDHELANRLSYFLWSTMPDDELFTLATKGTLHEPVTLRAQVSRMLKDSRAAALTENFAVQWLGLRRVGSFAPDRFLFSDYDEHLERAMVAETKAFFREVLTHDLDVRSFITSDWAMLNERMARHYGIAGVTSETFQRVTLPPKSQRGGLLTQASILSLTSDGTRTKPVDRGKWVLENLLGTPPPPPPPNAGQLPDIPEFSRLPLRERIEKHRQVESCAACHAKIDPLGLALENFDAIGAWRDSEIVPDDAAPAPKKKKKIQTDLEKIAEAHSGKRVAINAATQLHDGRQIADAAGLRAALLQDQDKFLHCLCEKMLTYALGRGLGYSDRETITKLQNGMIAQHTLSGLITDIVLSDAFQSK